MPRTVDPALVEQYDPAHAFALGEAVRVLAEEARDVFAERLRAEQRPHPRGARRRHLARARRVGEQRSQRVGQVAQVRPEQRELAAVAKQRAEPQREARLLREHGRAGEQLRGERRLVPAAVDLDRVPVARALCKAQRRPLVAREARVDGLAVGLARADGGKACVDEFAYALRNRDELAARVAPPVLADADARALVVVDPGAASPHRLRPPRRRQQRSRLEK